MKTYAYLGAFVALFLFLGIGTVESLGEDRLSAPVFREGKYWEFDHLGARNPQISDSRREEDGIYRYEVKSSQIEGSKRVLENRPLLYIQVETTSGTDEIIGDETTKEPNKRWYDFPLFVGKEWTYKYFYRIPGARQGTRREAKMKVLEIAPITTPAGSCDTFKIRREDRRNSTYYYCPETKSMISFDLDPVTMRDGTVVTVSTKLIKHGIMPLDKLMQIVPPRP